MNSPATARIALAAILIFSASIAIGAEKKKPIVPPKKELPPARPIEICPPERALQIDDLSQMPAMLEKLEKTIPATPDEAEELRENKFHLHFNIAIIDARNSQYENSVAHLRSAAALLDQDSDADARSGVNEILIAVHQRNDYFEEALPLAKTALAYREHTLGPEHPDTLRRAYTLATLQSATGDLASAETLCRRVLKVREQTLGSAHEDTIKCVTLLAELRAKKGDTTATIALYERALKDQERLYDSGSSSKLLSAGNLAESLSIKPDITRAEADFLRSLHPLDDTRGSERPYTCRTAYNLALLYQKKKDFTKALALAEQAVKGWTKTLGVGHEKNHSRANPC